MKLPKKRGGAIIGSMSIESHRGRQLRSMVVWYDPSVSHGLSASLTMCL